jgi:hypothetical protein
LSNLSGIYRAIVKNNSDPKKQNRLKVSIPQLIGTQVTDWIDSVEPAGVRTDLPVIGQGVWVSFIGGNINYPVWLGAFGKNKGKNKKIFIKPLANTTSLTGLSTHVITAKKSDGTTEVDLTATIIALANKVKTLETTVTTLKNTLATRTAGGHTHGSNG